MSINTRASRRKDYLIEKKELHINKIFGSNANIVQLSFSITHLPATPTTTKMHAHMAANIVAEFGYTIGVMVVF